MYCFEVGNLINWITEHEETIRGWVISLSTIILAFVAYLQVRASHRQISESKLQRRIEKHNEDLKELINYWWDNFPKPPTTGFEIFRVNGLFSLDYFSSELIEQNPLFLDLKNHIPLKFANIMEKWENYKALLKTYSDKQQGIIDKISNRQNEKLDFTFPDEAVFIKAIELLTGNKHYDYKIEQITNLEPPSFQLSYDYFGRGYNLTTNSVYYEELDSIKINFEEISNKVKNKYKIDIENLIKIEDNIKKIYRELMDKLNILRIYPEYNNMTCEYVIQKS